MDSPAPETVYYRFQLHWMFLTHAQRRALLMFAGWSPMKSHQLAGCRWEELSPRLQRHVLESVQEIGTVAAGVQQPEPETRQEVAA